MDLIWEKACVNAVAEKHNLFYIQNLNMIYSGSLSMS